MTISDHSRHGVTVNNDKLKPGENRALEPGDIVTLPFSMEYKFAIIPGGRARPLCPSLSAHSAPLHVRRILLPGLAARSLAVCHSAPMHTPAAPSSVALAWPTRSLTVR